MMVIMQQRQASTLPGARRRLWLYIAMLLPVMVCANACTTAPSNRSDTQRLVDVELAARIKDALLHDPRIYDAHIDVTAYYRVVRLSGTVSEAEDFAEAKHVAKSVPGVKGVISELNLVDRR
jgi:osmotically-inducible protein OsmY